MTGKRARHAATGLSFEEREEQASGASVTGGVADEL
jgi:hypothetical protein